MSATKLVDANNLSATFTSAEFALKQEGLRELTLGVVITNGAGIAPTSAPVGTWSGEWSWDGDDWFPLDDADVLAQFAKLSATGNNLVRQSAKISGVPGELARFTFTRSSGGGAGAACDLWAETRAT